MKSILYIFFYTTLGSCLFSTTINAQKFQKEPLYFQTYTIEDGLADNWIRDLNQDQFGYLWIATNTGLNRFDGHEFETYRNDPDDPNSLSSNTINSIYVDPSNVIWIATNESIDRFDRESEKFIHYALREVQQDRSSGEFLSTSDGTLYYGCESGLYMYQPDSDTFRVISSEPGNEPLLSSSDVRGLTEDSEGNLWIATNGGGINILDPKKEEVEVIRHDPDDPESFPNDMILGIYIDDEETVWVNYDPRERPGYGVVQDELSKGDPSGLWKKDLQTGDVTHYRYDPDKGHPGWALVSKIYNTDDGKLWFTQNSGVFGGLRVYDHESDAFFTYDYSSADPGSVPWNFMDGIFEDRTGQFWVASSRGLARANRDQIQMNAFSPDPSDKYAFINNFYGIVEVAKDQFFISGDQAPILFWDKAQGKFNWISSDLTATHFAGQYDGSEFLWFFNDGDFLSRYHPVEKTVKNFGLRGEGFEGVTMLHYLLMDKDLILVASDKGLIRFRPSINTFEWVDKVSHGDSQDARAVAYLAHGNKGETWFAQINTDPTNNEIRIGRYDPDTDEVMYPPLTSSYENAFSSGLLTHILVDSRGWIWVSKTNGLVKLDPATGEAIVYDNKSGIRHIRVLGTVEDDNGNIWISTEFGISFLDPLTGVIKNYGNDDGLRPSRMNAEAIFKRENGELMFAGVGGLSYFDPTEIKESEALPPITLVKLEAGDEEFSLLENASESSSPRIDSDVSSVSIEYVSINFQSPEETTYSYRLDGLHEDWVDAGKRRFAQFSNLSPGTYHFMVKARNADGQYSIEPASFTFEVLPPWYRTWWAYGAYTLMLLAVLFLIDRTQRRRVQRKEQERAREKELEQAKQIEKAYQDLERAHEDLKAAQQQLVQQEKLASLGQLTAGIAHEIKNPLNFVNNFSDVSVELIQEAKDEVKEINSKFKIQNFELSDLLDDIEANLKTIHKHGSRADSIVKSMLQHSRGSDGKMEPTPLNPLIKEYVNLAFHGMRAGKDPINVDIQMELDENIGEVPLIAEDFSRVILNLVNNGFDAMREKTIQHSKSNIQNYAPKLMVRTVSDNGMVHVEIEDNGPGIPDEIKDKILQPFFTTKKGTEGTGLGLSITNDIVKAHGGQIHITSGSDGGTRFIIEMPLKQEES